MPINAKQRAYLRSLANTLPAILFVGKEGVTAATAKEAYDALEARELIKCAVQQNAPVNARQACEQLCALTHAEPVQCIGSKFVIYRKSDGDRHVLPE